MVAFASRTSNGGGLRSSFDAIRKGNWKCLMAARARPAAVVQVSKGQMP